MPKHIIHFRIFENCDEECQTANHNIAFLKNVMTSVNLQVITFHF